MRGGAGRQESRPPGEAPCLPAPCSLQTDKEQLTAEAKELRQKVKYLQDQLSPLTRQREYQEKEIQRLNKVGRASLSPCSAHPVAWVRARALRAMVQPHGLRPPPFPPHALGASPGRALLCRPWDVLFAHTMLPEHHAGGASTLPPQQGLLPLNPAPPQSPLGHPILCA